MELVLGLGFVVQSLVGFVVVVGLGLVVVFVYEEFDTGLLQLPMLL